METTSLDAIIIGGSYAGLSAAMALGRSLRQVLVIDSGEPCNRQTPHAHNFITQDGETPAAISQKAREQVQAYGSVAFLDDVVVEAEKTTPGFRIRTASGKSYTAGKLVFATGIRDIMPDVEGFASCWGISVIHCPYCHGYEVRNKKTGILANGNDAFHYARLVSNLSKDLTLFTNGEADFSQEQFVRLKDHGIPVVEKPVAGLKHKDGYVSEITFTDGTAFPIKAIYSRPRFEQACLLPKALGCEPTEHGLLKTDMFQQTTVAGVFACGDNASPLRSVSYAIAAGNLAGAAVNGQLSEEYF